MREFWPGTRLLMFDSRLFKDDRTTPLSLTMQPCTILRWYGTNEIPGFEDRHKYSARHGGKTVEELRVIWRYGSLVDVRWDRDGCVTRGKFADDVYGGPEVD